MDAQPEKMWAQSRPELLEGSLQQWWGYRAPSRQVGMKHARQQVVQSISCQTGPGGGPSRYHRYKDPVSIIMLIPSSASHPC